MISPNQLLAMAWLWHAVFTSLVTIGIAKAAIRVCGWPRAPRIRCWRKVPYPDWPLQGRWLLVLKFTGLSIMLLDVARLAYERQILQHGPAIPVTWGQALIRLVPVPLGPWLFYRLWTRGLTSDDPE